MFSRLIILAAFLPLLSTMPASVAAQGMCPRCDLPPGCRGNNPKPNKNKDCTPVSVNIESDLDFGRLVLLGDGVGQVIIDLNTGQKTTSGNINDLGGMAFKGVARISGKANSPIQIILPGSISMTDASGSQAELTELRTDMPLVAYLDGSGQLEFSFTGSLKTDNPIGGNLRGRIPISVQYN